MLHRQQPIYRRGPDWTIGLSPPTWPPTRLYGPPVSYDSRGLLRERDFRSFAVGLLIIETVVSVVGFYVIMHLLKGQRMRYLTPPVKLGLMLGYSTTKMLLIDSAFHGSFYVLASTIFTIVIAICACVAVLFHLGPLIWAFSDGRYPQQTPDWSWDHLVHETKHYFIRHHLSDCARAHASPESESACSVSTKNGVAIVPWLFGDDLTVRIDDWNQYLTTYWSRQLIVVAQKRRRALPGIDDGSISEARFLFVMQTDGLLLDFLLDEPDTKLIYSLCSDVAMPFELVLRFMMRYQSGKQRPVFLYAECVHLASRSTTEQKEAIYEMLRRLNAACHHRVDVPLRSLRCQDFVQAGYLPPTTTKASRRRRMRRSMARQIEGFCY